MGKLIIFEGLDGSGKGTQTNLLCQALRARGADLRQITFPDYESDSSALVRMYLSGRFGQRPDDVNALCGLRPSMPSTALPATRPIGANSTAPAAWSSPTATRPATPCTSAPSCRPCTGTAFWTGCTTLSTKKWASPRPTPSSTSRSMSKSRRGCWPARTMATPPKWIFRKKIPNTWPAPRAAAEYCAHKLGWRRIDCTREENGKKIMRTPEDIHAEVLAQLGDIL